MPNLPIYNPNRPEEWCQEQHQLFYDGFKEYLANLLFSLVPELTVQECSESIEYLARRHVGIESISRGLEYAEDNVGDDEEFQNSHELEEAIRYKTIEIKDIVFPPQKKGAHPDYNNLFACIPCIQLVNCSFHCNNLLGNTEKNSIHFLDSVFYEFWQPDFYQRRPQYIALFKSCIFKSGVKITSAISDYYSVIFSDCAIDFLEVADCILERNLFDHDNREIKQLFIHNCALESPLILTLNKFESIDIVDTVFNSDVFFNQCAIKDLKITETVFKQTLDFTNSIIEKFINANVEYQGFAIFESCQLGTDPSIKKDEAIQLSQVTFHKAVNFRDAVFMQQFDLRNTSFLQIPTFLGCQFNAHSRKQTDRETFRIIKQAFAMVGNQIETNRIYAYEMEAYRQELRGVENKTCKLKSELALITLNYWFSDYGQSYIKPAAWIIILAIFLALTKAYGSMVWSVVPVCIQSCILIFYNLLNEFAKGFIFLRPLLDNYPDHEFVVLMTSLLFSTFIWHFLIAVRRHAKR